MEDYRRIILRGQEQVSAVKILKRNIKFNYEYLDLHKIISFVGPRRAGKTYFMFSVLRELIKQKKLFREQIVFVDFTSFLYDDFDIERLLESFYELYPHQKPFFVFDEIQELKSFQKIVMYVFNSGYKVFLSGSNSKLLSSELSTVFRGRTIDVKIFPLDFREFLFFKKVETGSFYTERQKGILKGLIQEFIQFGAYPEIALSENTETKQELTKSYFSILLYKDLLQRYGIENEYVINFLIKRLLLSVTKEFNINKTFNEIKSQNIKVGKQTLYNYLEYLKEIFFIKEIEDEFRKGAKKFFFYDVAYNNILLLENFGQRFENIVYSELIRNFEKVIYRKNNVYEIDFIVPEKDLAIQVCYELHSLNIEREIKCFGETDFKHNFLIYSSREKVFEVPGVEMMDFWEFVNRLRELG